jgi:hypothetical protein
MKSPREAYLEREVSILKAKLASLERGRYSTMSFLEEPTIQCIERATPTLELVASAGWYYEDSGYHFYAKEYGFNENQNLYYYLSDRTLLDAWDRAAILQRMLDKVTHNLIEVITKETK